MTNPSKSVADMTAEEYYDYLMSLDDAEFFRAVSHDVKKVTSVVHGYVSLIRLDIEENTVERESLAEYTDMMEDMLEKSYFYIDVARAVFKARFLS